MDFITGFHIEQYKSYCGFLCYTGIILIEINSELSSQYLKIGGSRRLMYFTHQNNSNWYYHQKCQ